MKEEDEAVERAQKWLEDMSKGLGRELEALTLEGLQITLVHKGLVRCTFVIPQNVSVRKTRTNNNIYLSLQFH